MDNFTMYAINKMLYETCGEDPNVVNEAKVTQISENAYHIQYRENDPYQGIDFKFRMNFIETVAHRYIVEFDIYESIYADTGSFEIKLI